MKVTIIGFGRIGQGICSKLISKKYLTEIFVINEDKERTEKAISMMHSKKVSFAEELPNNLDYCIICISAMPEKARIKSWKTREKTFEMREDELRYNLKPMSKIAEKLKGISKQTRIIIITNPMETFTNLFARNLNKDNIIGFGTSLDCARYSRVIGKKSSCMGEHGKAIPLIGIKDERDYTTLHKAVDKKVIRFLREKGMTSEITSEEFSKFLDALTNTKKSIAVLSHFLKKPFLGIKNVAISLPYYVQNGKVLSPVKLNVSKVEKEIFVKQAKDLKSRLAKLI